MTAAILILLLFLRQSITKYLSKNFHFFIYFAY
nr:MAG TPA: hypothetical protein [Caudoviricetes sp.]